MNTCLTTNKNFEDKYHKNKGAYDHTTAPE